MAKQKADHEQKEELAPEIETTEPISEDLSLKIIELEEKIKLLENEKVDLISKHKIECESYSAKIDELTIKFSEKETDFTNALATISKMKEIKREEAIKEPIDVSEPIAIYKYRVGDLVTMPIRYQNLQFKVHEQLGEGVRGPLYTIYAGDQEIMLSHVSEIELRPVVNKFRDK